MKIGLNYMEPFTLATLRCSVAGLAMIAYLEFRKIPRPKLSMLPDYAAVGFFQTVAMFGLLLYGMKYVTAGKTSVLLYTMPIWTSLIVHFYLKERLELHRWIGVALGTLGIIFILGRDVMVHWETNVLTGEFLIIIASVSWAVSNIWVKRRMGAEDVYMVNGIQLVIGAFGLALLAISIEDVMHIIWTPYTLYIILFTGLVSSAVNFTIWFYLIKNMDIHITTHSSMLVPVFGLLFDWLILGTKLDIGVIIGGVLIIAGIYKISK